jgi:hypothetical protein
MLMDDPVVGGISYSNNGGITVPGKSGLGAVIDDSYLKRLTKTVVG